MARLPQDQIDRIKQDISLLRLVESQDSPEALAYLEKRGLNDVELIHTFKLGFANRTLAYHIPDSKREAGKKIRGLASVIVRTVPVCDVLVGCRGKPDLYNNFSSNAHAN